MHVWSSIAMANEAPETVYVMEKKVACDGGEGALGHPRVYLTMGADGKVECPYCDRLFILDQSGAKAA